MSIPHSSNKTPIVFAHLYAFLLILFIPFPFYVFPFQIDLTSFLFSDLLTYSVNIFFGNQAGYQEINSDSPQMYLLFVLLLFISAVITFISAYINRWETIKPRVIYLIRSLIICYLVTILFKYGFDKIFKKQFYIPEPNILYTPFGQLDKDILYWSTIGTSYTYSLITGILEVLTAGLILMRRTRTMGLIMSIGLLLNILLINISFNISVKLFTCYLIFLSVLILAPKIPGILRFFLDKKPIEPQIEIGLKNIVPSFPVRVSIITFIIGIILIESLYPHVRSRNFNDDKAERPYLHGAYEVISTDPDSVGAAPVHRIFIHRNGYLIFQNKEDEMHDYKLQIDSIQHLLVLTDYDLKSYSLKYATTFDGLQIEYFMEGKRYFLNTKRLDWQNLPALKDEFDWVDRGK